MVKRFLMDAYFGERAFSAISCSGVVCLVHYISWFDLFHCYCLLGMLGMLGNCSCNGCAKNVSWYKTMTQAPQYLLWNEVVLIFDWCPGRPSLFWLFIVLLLWCLVWFALLLVKLMCMVCYLVWAFVSCACSGEFIVIEFSSGRPHGNTHLSGVSFMFDCRARMFRTNVVKLRWMFIC